MYIKKIAVALISIIVLILIFWLLLYFNTNILSESPLKSKGYVEDFKLTDERGRPFTNKDMLGKVCVVNFFFTTCQSVCPKMNATLKDIYTRFYKTPQVLFVSFTCDPQHDTPDKLSLYAQSLGVDTTRWFFITGRKDSLYSLARFSFGIDDPKNIVANIDDDFIHSQFVALVDKQGRVRGGVYDSYNKKDMKELQEDMRTLLQEP
ncbi:MAG: SCO family protein [Phycisphaerales bacterium]|nr:SCO family protein [Phycisphaerales bacterium]